MGNKAPNAPTSQVLTAPEKAKLGSLEEIYSIAAPLSLVGNELQIDTSGLLGIIEWTPSVSAGVNIAATADPAGRLSYVAGPPFVLTCTVNLLVTPTLALNTPTSFEIDLPASSAFTDASDCIGSGCFAGGIGAPVIVSASVANGTAVIAFASTLAGAAQLSVVFQYKVTP